MLHWRVFIACLLLCSRRKVSVCIYQIRGCLVEILILSSEEPSTALDHLNHVVRIRRAVYGDTHFEVARSLHTLAKTLKDNGQLGESLDCLKEQLRIMECIADLRQKKGPLSQTLQQVSSER